MLGENKRWKLSVMTKYMINSNIWICNTRLYHRWISTVISVQCALLGYEYDLNLYHSTKPIFHVSLFVCFYVASVIRALWLWQQYHSWTLIFASKINVLFYFVMSPCYQLSARVTYYGSISEAGLGIELKQLPNLPYNVYWMCNVT
jgi:hypothetical protein